MKTENEKQNKKVLIIGFGVTGQAVARFLTKKGKDLVVIDNKSQDNFDDYLLRRFGDVEFHFETTDFDSSQFEFIVASPGVHLDTPDMEKAFEENIPVYNDITLFMEEWRKMGGRVVGVTGSNGKTTIVSLLYDVIKDNVPAILGGNIGNSPLDLLDIKYAPGTVAVLELSSYQLEAFGPEHWLDVCVISNLSSNHVDRYHGKMSEYARAKTLGIDSEKTEVIITTDDEGTNKYVAPILKENKVRGVNIVSLETSVTEANSTGIYTNENSDLVYVPKGKGGVADINNANVLFSKTDDRRLIGLHNLYNIAFVLLAAKIIGIDVSEKVTEKIRNFIGLEHRIEKVAEINGVVYINDSKSTSPESTRVALEAISGDRDTVLIIGGEDKDMSYDYLANIFSQKLAEIVLLQGSIADKIKKLAENSNIKLTEVQNMAEAVSVASELATKMSGDNKIVLLSPASASFRDYKSFEERGADFKARVKDLKNV